MGNLSSTFEKLTVPTVLVHRKFMDKNKQLTLLSQCKLAFTGRNVLMALKIQRNIKKYKNPGATLALT
jgi:hypothetical protein